jgi:nucleoside-diphosphate-sugar epimerase
VVPVPKNIYGVSKAAAEDLCQLFQRNQDLPCIVLRTSRFFPEEDDDRAVRDVYDDDNAKANEYLHRRVDVEDVVSAHLLAARHAPALGFRRYIVSATTPFLADDLADLRRDAAAVVRRRVPQLRSGICAPRLDDGTEHRPRLCQRASSRRAGLAATP